MEHNILKLGAHTSWFSKLLFRCLKKNFKQFLCAERMFDHFLPAEFSIFRLTKVFKLFFHFCLMQFFPSLFLSGFNCFVSSHFVYSLHYNPLSKPLRNFVSARSFSEDFFFFCCSKNSISVLNRKEHEKFFKVQCPSLDKWRRRRERSSLWSFGLQAKSQNLCKRREFSGWRKEKFNVSYVLVTLWKAELKRWRDFSWKESGKRFGGTRVTALV